MSSSVVVASLVFLAVPLTALFQRCGAADSNNTYFLGSPKWNCFPPDFLGSSVQGVRPYQANLRQLLEKLPSNAISNNGFYNSTKGLNYTMFGVAMCHADIEWPEQCKSCLEVATAKASEVCQWRNNASVAYRGCILLYSDVPILASEDEDDISNAFAFHTSYHAVSIPDYDTASFWQKRKELFAILADEAANSSMMIASNNLTFNSTHNLYGLAQCSRGLPREICSRVIRLAIHNIKYFTGAEQWSEGLSLTANSYYIRYDLTPFRVSEHLTGSGVPSDSEKKPTAGVYKQPHTGSRAPSESETKGGLVLIIVISICISTIILLVMFILWQRYLEKQKILDILEFTDLQDIPYGDILSATGNFDETNLLGEGGFGKVYKGTFIIDGKEKELAVKCVTNPSARKQLLGELKILAKLEHRNVVRLVGFCRNDRWWFQFGKGCNGLYICNEFICNRSLDKHLFASSGPISWQIRYNIILDICKGLAYLHENCNNTISHMDLKPSNILLDEEMNPKIADFGLSKTFVNSRTHTFTSTVIGTNGYMAPEFVDDGRAGRKCDIYSLGVLILVIVMLDEPRSIRDPCGIRFIDRIRNMFIMDEETTPRMCTAKDREQVKRDASLERDDRLEDMEKCIGLAFDCVDGEPDNRPLATAIYNSLIQQVTAQGRSQLPQPPVSALEIIQE